MTGPPATDRPPLVMQSRPALSPLAVFGVCALLAAAILAAAVGATHGAPSNGGDRSAWAERLIVDLAAAVEVLTVVAMVATLVLLVTSGWARSGIEREAATKRSWWGRAATLAACVAVALALARTTPHSAHRPGPPPSLLRITPDSGSQTRRSRTPSPDWAAVIGLLGLAGAGVALAGWHASGRSRRRRARAPWGSRALAPGDTAADRLGPAIRAGLYDLRTETDPRRAVIACYGAMEAALRQAGFGRRPAEAPVEYLGRVMRDAGVTAGAGSRLTELFQRAGFSTGPVAEADRHAALDALRSVEAELSAPPDRQRLEPAPAQAGS